MSHHDAVIHWRLKSLVGSQKFPSRKVITSQALADSLSCEGLPYSEIPQDMRDRVVRFRKLRQDERKRRCRAVLEGRTVPLGQQLVSPLVPLSIGVTPGATPETPPTVKGSVSNMAQYKDGRVAMVVTVAAGTRFRLVVDRQSWQRIVANAHHFD